MGFKGGVAGPMVGMNVSSAHKARKIQRTRAAGDLLQGAIAVLAATSHCLHLLVMRCWCALPASTLRLGPNLHAGVPHACYLHLPLIITYSTHLRAEIMKHVETDIVYSSFWL